MSESIKVGEYKMFKRILYSIITLLPLATLLTFCNQFKNTQAEADIEEIKSVLVETVKAFNSEDTEAFLSFFTEDVIRMQPDTWNDVSKEEIQKWYENVKAKFTYKCEITADEIIIADDWAFVRNTCRGQLIPKSGGDPIPGFGGSRHVTIFKKQLDGSWKIARDIWNNPPPNNP